MRQPQIIHEHYNAKPWFSIILEFLTIAFLVSSQGLSFLNKQYPDTSLALKIVILGIPVLYLILVFLDGLYWKRKPTIVVYNDRLEVRKPFSLNRTEIMYSDIRNVDCQFTQLMIWRNETAAPECYNMGVKAKIAEETFNYIRSSFDKYCLENNIKPAPVDSLPKKKTSLQQVVMIITMLAVLALFFILSKN